MIKYPYNYVLFSLIHHLSSNIHYPLSVTHYPLSIIHFLFPIFHNLLCIDHYQARVELGLLTNQWDTLPGPVNSITAQKINILVKHILGTQILRLGFLTDCKNWYQYQAQLFSSWYLKKRQKKSYLNSYFVEILYKEKCLNVFNK